MCPAIVSGIVTGDAALVSYKTIFFPVPSSSPRSLGESLLGPYHHQRFKHQPIIFLRCEGKA